MSLDACPSCGISWANVPPATSGLCGLFHGRPELAELALRVARSQHPDWVFSNGFTQALGEDTLEMSHDEVTLWERRSSGGRDLALSGPYTVERLVQDVLAGVPDVVWPDEPPEGLRPAQEIGEP